MVLLQEKEFTSAEHRYLGNVKLNGLNPDFTKFEFPNGVKLTFGEIILLSGDYIGENLIPISLGMSEILRQKRFLESYEKLAKYNPEKIYQITENVADDNTAVDFMLKDIDGRYLLLAEHNIDHFGDYALVAFKTGYTLAMQAAVKASKLSDSAEKNHQLQYAYSLLAFACHFMTDLFASGHMRTPRMELDEMYSPEIGSLLSYLQHNEDGDLGLEVQSASVGNMDMTTWMAFGDGHLFEGNNSECNKRALNAVQAAADEIYQGFINKVEKSVDDSIVLSLIPTVTNNNPPPMFRVDQDGNLLCRTPIGGEPQDEYAELTRMKLLEILIYYSQQYLTSTLKSTFDYLINIIKKDKEYITKSYLSLSRLSLFSQPAVEEEFKENNQSDINRNSLT